VAESAVVGLPDEVTGQSIAAFVVLKKNQVSSPDLKEDLKELVAKKIGVIAKPKNIYFVEELPKTRSGKIMRRLLKEMVLGKTFGDLTALEDPRLLKTLESCMEGK